MGMPDNFLPLLFSVLIAIAPLAQAQAKAGGHPGRHHSGSAHTASNSGSNAGGSHSKGSRSKGSHHAAGFHAGAGHPSSHKAVGVALDHNGKIKRSQSAKRDFEHNQPCPSTGETSGACAGYVIDHVRPLKRGGADAPSNMTWQTK